MSLVSSPSIVNISSFLRSILSCVSSLNTCIGIFSVCSITSSSNTSFMSYFAVIDSMSTPGSFLCPNILTTSPLYVLSFSLLVSLISTLCPFIAPIVFFGSIITCIFTFLSSNSTYGLPCL